jgi:hypothetical protein
MRTHRGLLEMMSESEYVTIAVDQPPEAMAEALMADALPPRWLDSIKLGSFADAATLLEYLGRRAHYAAIEKDELVAFAKANDTVLSPDAVRHLARVADGLDDEPMAEYLRYILDNLALALEGDYDAVNLRSDRLLWLVYALGTQVRSGILGYDAARAILAKPEHAARISPAALQYQTVDYVKLIDSPQAGPTECVMLLAEGALATHDLDSLLLAFIAVRHSPQPRDVASWADLIERAAATLRRHGKLDADGEAFAERVAARRAHVSEDDF